MPAKDRRATRSRYGKVVRPLSVQLINWEWAKKHAGGASAYINFILGMHRRREEQQEKNKRMRELIEQNRQLLDEVQRLKARIVE